MRFKLFKSEKGVTIVEMMLYFAILSLFMAITSSIYGQVLDVQLDSQSRSSVIQDEQYISAYIARSIAKASSVTTPALGGVGSQLQIVVPIEGSYTFKLDASSNLTVTNSDGVDIILNGYDTLVSGLTFTNIGTAGHESIKFQFTLTSKTKRNNQPEIRTYQSTVSLR